MKKQLVILIAGSALLLSGCRPFGEKNSLTNQSLSSTGTIMSTKQAIKQYLLDSNKDIQQTVVNTGDTIIVDYIGRLDEENVFDTSIKSVAQAAGIYNEARDYEAGLEFTVGKKQMIAGFDTGVLGMKLGETRTLNIPADQAYGPKRDELIITIPLSQAGNISGLTVGMEVMVGQQMPAVITAITDKDITFDANPKLAGKDLIFDVTIRSITPAN